MIAMAPTRGPSSFLPNSRNERAARDWVPLPPARRSTKFMKSAHHSLVGRPIWVALRPRQRSASSSTAAAPGTCAAASVASLRLRVIGSSGSVLAKRSVGFAPVA